MRKVKELFEKVQMFSNGFIACIVCLFVIALGLGLGFGFLCLKAWVVMLLWNWVMVGLFSLPALGFWYAVGISLLTSLLFKSRKISTEE